MSLNVTRHGEHATLGYNKRDRNSKETIGLERTFCLLISVLERKHAIKEDILTDRAKARERERKRETKRMNSRRIVALNKNIRRNEVFNP